MSIENVGHVDCSSSNPYDALNLICNMAPHATLVKPGVKLRVFRGIGV